MEHQWVSNKKAPLEAETMGETVEIRYLDRFNVTRTSDGFNGPPLGVYCDNEDGSKLPGAQSAADGHLSRVVPYARIKYWRRA